MAIKIKRKVQFTLTAVFDNDLSGQRVFAAIYNTANKSRKIRAYYNVASDEHSATFTFPASSTVELEEGMASLDLYTTSNGGENEPVVWMATAEKFATVINVSVS